MNIMGLIRHKGFFVSQKTTFVVKKIW